MKIVLGFCLALFAICHAFPAKNDETEFIDPKFGDQPIVDTGVIGGGGGYFDVPLDSIFQNMMKRMREQMDALLNGFYSKNGTIDSFPDTIGFPSISELDLGKGNTTSVTKIINGHKVVINETEYKNEDKNGGAFFKVRIIDVKPEGGSDAGTGAPRDVESVEKDAHENEIKKTDNNEVNEMWADNSRRWENLEDFSEFNAPPYDLSNDINVNNYLESKNFPRNPDAEFINVYNPNVETFIPIKQEYYPENYYQKYYQEFFEDNRVDNRPRDLSNDIYVNQLIAARPYQPNPYAETFNPNERYK